VSESENKYSRKTGAPDEDSNIDAVPPYRKKFGMWWPKTKRTTAYVTDSDEETVDELHANLVSDACKKVSMSEIMQGQGQSVQGRQGQQRNQSYM